MNKGWFLLVSIFLGCVQVFSSSHSADHSFGPSFPLEYVSQEYYVLVGAGLLVAMVFATLLLESNVQKISLKANKTVSLVLLGVASSLPLIIISITSALSGNTTIALVSIIGTNIANITLVLGLLGLLKPLSIGKNFLIGVCAFITLLALTALFFVSVATPFDQQASPIIDQKSEAFLEIKDVFWLVVIFFIFLVLVQKFFHQIPVENVQFSLLGATLKSLLYGTFVCWSAFEATRIFILIAQINNVPDIIIATTLVLIGTSLPELSVGLAAIVKKHDVDVSSNLIMSVLVNLVVPISLILAITKTMVVEDFILSYHIPFLLLSFLFAIGCLYSRVDFLGRFKSLLLIGLYVLFIVGLSVDFHFF
ncbi:MAG: sodium:calcium antiporter [Candidatus Woesearchaeota archaeon]